MQRCPSQEAESFDADQYAQLFLDAATFEETERFKETLTRVLYAGLRWGGATTAAGIVLYVCVEVFAMGRPVTWVQTPEFAREQVTLLEDLLLVALCGGAAVLPTLRPSLAQGRIFAAGSALVAAGVFLRSGLVQGAIELEFVALLYILVIVAIPFRPWQALWLGAGIGGVFYVLVEGGGLVPTAGPDALQVGRHALTLSASVALGVIVSTVLYATRLAQHRSSRAANEALQEERDRFETLFNSLPTPIVHGKHTDGGLVVEDVNTTFRQTFGYDKKEAEGAFLDALIVPPQEQEEARQISQEAVDAGLLRTEAQRTTVDGVRDFRIQVAIRAERNEAAKGYGIYTDITERKEREREIERLRTVYRGLLRGAPNAIFIANADTREIIEVNRAAASLLDMPPDRIVGRQPEDLHPQEKQEAYRALFEKHKQVAGGRPTTTQTLPEGSQLFVVTASGERVPVEISSTTIEVAGETFLVSIFRDITERLRRVQALKEAKQEAERASRMKSAFLANMSHEIRTPLTSIIGFAEAIGEEAATLQAENAASAVEELDLETLGRFSGLIEKNGNRLLETLNGILRLSKLEVGEMELSMEAVDLATEAEEIEAQFRKQANEATVTLELDAEDGAWARADSGGAQIALHNLVSNAIKYTEEGGTVWIRVDSTPNAVVVEVEDTGIGMESSEAAELFEPFRQESDGVDREYEGTGLGLAVTKQVIEEMGGSIEVETEKGVGSCFTVRLPKTEPGTP